MLCIFKQLGPHLVNGVVMHDYRNRSHQTVPDLQATRLPARPFVKLRIKQGPARAVVNKIDLWALDSVVLGLLISFALLVATGFAIYALWIKISAL